MLSVSGYSLQTLFEKRRYPLILKTMNEIYTSTYCILTYKL